MAHNNVLNPSKHSLIHVISEFSKSSPLHPQNPSKPFILTCRCGGRRQSYRSRSHLDCLFLQSNLVANFNLPASYSLSPDRIFENRRRFHIDTRQRRESEGEVGPTTCDKGRVQDLSERHRRRMCLLSCRDVYRRCWKLTLCVTTTDG